MTDSREQRFGVEARRIRYGSGLAIYIDFDSSPRRKDADIAVPATQGIISVTRVHYTITPKASQQSREGECATQKPEFGSRFLSCPEP